MKIDREKLLAILLGIGLALSLAVLGYAFFLSAQSESERQNICENATDPGLIEECKEEARLKSQHQD